MDHAVVKVSIYVYSGTYGDPVTASSRQIVPPGVLVGAALAFLSSDGGLVTSVALAKFRLPPVSEGLTKFPPWDLVVSVIIVTEPTPLAVRPVSPSVHA